MLPANKMANYLLIVQGATPNTQPKRPWASGFFFFFPNFYLLLCQQYVAPRVENFQTSICLENDAANFFSLTKFCGYSGEERNCRRTATASSVHFAFCSSYCESTQFALCKRQGLNEICYGEWCPVQVLLFPSIWMPKGQSLHQKVPHVESFIYMAVQDIRRYQRWHNLSNVELRTGVRVTFS